MMTDILRSELKMQTGEMYTNNGYFRYKGKDILGEKFEINVKSEPTKEGLEELRQKVEKHNRDLQDKLDAEKFEEEFKMNMIEAYRNKDMTVYQASQMYLYQMTANNKTVIRKDNTIKSYNSSFNSLQKYDFMNKKVTDIIRVEARDFVETLADDYKGNTVVQLHTFLKQVFNECIGNGCIEINPFDFTINPERTIKEILSKKQQEDLLTYIRNSKEYSKYYEYVVIFIETGLRIGEFLGLTLDCIDFDNKRILVSKQTTSNGKVTTELKTLTSRRYVDISDKAEIALKKIIAELPKKRTVIDGFSDFLFVSRNGKPKAHTTIQKVIREIRKTYQNEIDNSFPNITPHTFRHTYATNKALEGMSVLDLFKKMGHADYNTTLRVYVHLKDENGICINAGLSKNEIVAKYDSYVDKNSSNKQIFEVPRDKVIKVDFLAHKIIS